MDLADIPEEGEDGSEVDASDDVDTLVDADGTAYQLTGIISHRGTSSRSGECRYVRRHCACYDAGHYICDVASAELDHMGAEDARWLGISDEQVHRMSVKEVLRERMTTCAMLVYTRM